MHGIGMSLHCMSLLLVASVPVAPALVQHASCGHIMDEHYNSYVQLSFTHQHLQSAQYASEEM